MKALLLAAFLCLISVSAFAACPNPLTGKDAAGTTQNFATQNDANNNCVSESAAWQNVQFNATLQSSATANGNGTAFSVAGLAGATMTVNCASCSGGTTVNFQGQEDGSNFVALQGTALGGGGRATSTTTAGVTVWQFNLTGLQQIRATISGYSAGTVTVTAHAMASPGAFPTVNVLRSTDEGAFTAGSSDYSNVGCLYQTTPTNNALTTGQAGAVQCTANRAFFANPRDSGGTEMANTTAHSVKVSPLDSGGGDMTNTTAHSGKVSPYDSGGGDMSNTTAHALKSALLDSGGGDMSDTTNHALSTEAYTINNAAAKPHVCGSHVYKHITTATDTQIVAANGSNNIYICDFGFSATASLNWYFEKSSTGTCGTPTQIDMLWTLVANQAKASTKAIYTGLNTGASQQLCVNTSAGNLDITVDYDQY